jgi:multidrug resistance efflux pump
METGPGYHSKRQEAVETMMPLLSSSENLMNIAGDLIFRNMDFPGAEVIADRLAASNPLANIDDKSDIPPQVQMQLAQSKQMMEQMQQQMQQMQMVIKNRADVIAMQQEGETKRKLMDVTSRAHNTETINEAKVNQTIMDAMVSQNKSELDAYTKLMLAKMDTGQLQSEIARRDAENQQVYAFAEGEVNQTNSPFNQR